MSESTTTTRTWVAIGATGAIGSIHQDETGYTVRIHKGEVERHGLPSLEAAKQAVHASLPADAERPEFREH